MVIFSITTDVSVVVIAFSLTSPQPHHPEAYGNFTDWNLAQATARELITFSEPVFQSIKWDDGPHSESCCEMKCRDAQHRFRGLGAVLDTFYPFAH